jgi:DNA polymerase-3 subunit epsilon
MTYLFFDTETTDIPDNDNAPTTDTENWPRLVQIAWTRVSAGASEIGDVLCYMVRPEGFTIPRKATAIHGITTERARENGHPVGDVLEAFLKAAGASDVLVAHHVNFDKSVVGAELVRWNGEDLLEPKPSLCTMKSTTVFCGQSNYYGYKWPSLQELHDTLFGEGFDDAHDAGADAEAGARCLLELLDRGIVKNPALTSQKTTKLDIFLSRNNRTDTPPF